MFLLTAGTEPDKIASEGEEFSDAMRIAYIRDHLRSRLIENHSRLKKTLEDVAWLVQHGSFITAAKRFGEFRMTQERTMNMEETLFPIIERLSGPNEPLRRNRANHETIRRLLDAVSASLATSSPHRFVEARRQLVAGISELWEHEERLLTTLEFKGPSKETIEKIEGALQRF
jgi:hypothetical protein